MTDPEQVKACTFDVAHNGTWARGLIGAKNRIEYADKETLIKTAWDVYACSSCKGDISACDGVPKQLKQLRTVIKEQQAAKQK